MRILAALSCVTDLVAAVLAGVQREGQRAPQRVERRGAAVQRHAAAARHAPPREPHARRRRLRQRRQRVPAHVMCTYVPTLKAYIIL